MSDRIRLPHLDPGRYAVTMVVTFLLKVALDLAIAQRFGSGSAWRSVMSPLTIDAIYFLMRDQLALAALIGVVTIPALAVWILATVSRLRGAGLSGWLALNMLVPGVNLLFFILMCCLSDVHPRRMRDADPAPPAASSGPSPAPLSVPGPRPEPMRFDITALATLATALITLGGAVLCTYGAKTYGIGLFVALPVLAGYSGALIAHLGRPRRLGTSLAVSAGGIALCLPLFLIVGFEGMICILMAAPIAVPLAMLGGLIAWAVHGEHHPVDERNHLHGMALLPLIAGAIGGIEQVTMPEPPLRAVRTAVDLPVGIERVWAEVIADARMDAAPAGFFRMGVAYPQQVEYRGRGPGTERCCTFSTGRSRQVIDLWDPPHRLTFRVVEHPEPMREWSPYVIHPPHLAGGVITVDGGFELTRLPDGGTRLTGVSRYRCHLDPIWYWQVWGDRMIDGVHGRMLDHIRRRCQPGE